MKELTISRALSDLMAVEPSMEPDRLFSEMWDRHPDLMRDQAETLQSDRLWAMWRRAAGAFEDMNQQKLPGLGFPKIFILQKADGSPYSKPSDEAVFDELEEARGLRAENVVRAQAKLDRFDDLYVRLRPLMEADRNLTVGEAKKRLGLD